jgi:hypothetical protein
MKTFALRILMALCFFTSLAHAKLNVQNKVAGPKIDILFVMDNSGTMSNSMQNLIANFPRFINSMQNSAVDYRIGVTTTEAYLSLYRTGDYARLRDGYDGAHSGVFVVTPETPDLSRVLNINLNQGTGGSGDERALSSFEEVLKFPGNSDFRRSDAALSVVVLSDEDDFSHSGSDFIENYNDPRIVPVTHFATILNTAGGSNAATFSALFVQDESCKNQLGGVPAKIGLRYQELADLTGGFKGSICDIGSALEGYAQHVINNATPVPAPDPVNQYLIKLDHAPIIETIVVKINGSLIRQDPTNGWQYDATTMNLILQGTAIPKKGDLVSVSYDYQE